VQVVKNLSGLLKIVNLGQLAALEELIKDWVKNGSIDKACIQVQLLHLFDNAYSDDRFTQ